MAEEGFRAAGEVFAGRADLGYVDSGLAADDGIPCKAAVDARLQVDFGLSGAFWNPARATFLAERRSIRGRFPSGEQGCKDDRV